MSGEALQTCIVNLSELDPPRNGGQSRVAREVSGILAEAFQSGAVDVHFVVGWRFAADFENWLGHTGLQAIPFFSEDDLRSALYSELRPDLIVSPLFGAWPFGSSNPFPGVPHVAAMPDAMALDFPELCDAATLADRRKRYAELKIVTFVATNSAHSKQRLVEHIGLPSDRVKIIPLGAELRTGSAADLPLQISRPYVFYPANGWPHKRHALLLQAIKLIRQRRPEVRLVLTGWQEPGYIEALARANDCDPHDYVALGHVADERQIATLYRNAEALMFTSCNEGFGMPVLEAMHYDCPVICAPVTSLPETAGGAALYVDSEDAGDWARAFLEELPERRSELIQRGRSQAEKYTWALSRQKWTELLAEAGLKLDRGPRQPRNEDAPRYHAALRELNAWAARYAQSDKQLQEKEAVIQDLAAWVEKNRAAMQEAQQRLLLFRSSPGFWLDNGPFAGSIPVRTLAKLTRQVFQLRFPSVAFQLQQYSPRPVRERRVAAAAAEPAMDLPSMSIVTPTYNHGRFIEETIRSVLDQGYPNLQYVVQDGGSTDGTLEVLQAYGPRLTAWESRADNGQADAVNLGFARTDGEIMGYINSDDVLLPGALDYVGEFFRDHSEVEVIYGHRIIIDDGGQEVGRWILPPHDSEILGWADYVPQETLFWRRRIWEKAGAALDLSYKFAMDWDMLLRFQQAGARIRRVPRFLALFRVHASQKTSAQLTGTGIQEMDRIRARFHGRSVSLGEVNQHVRAYQRRSVLYRQAFRLGLLRY